MDRQQKRTVCLLGSPRRNGNSEKLVACFDSVAREHGTSVESTFLADLRFDGCRNLFRCKTDLDRCGQTDDLTPVLESILQADVLLLASPIYFGNLTGQMKLAIDRFFSFLVPNYPTEENKSRLSPGRTLVLVQSQGEPEDRYGDILEGFAAGFRYLGYEKQYTIRAWGVREPDDVMACSETLAHCRSIAEEVYGT